MRKTVPFKTIRLIIRVSPKVLPLARFTKLVIDNKEEWYSALWAKGNAYSHWENCALFALDEVFSKEDTSWMKIPSIITGGKIAIQAAECGPWNRVDSLYAQIITNIAGEPLEPVVYLPEQKERNKSTRISAGGHIATFEENPLIVVRGEKGTQELSIIQYSHEVDSRGEKTKLSLELLYIGHIADSLLGNTHTYSHAVEALRVRLGIPNSKKMFFGITPEDARSQRKLAYVVEEKRKNRPSGIG
jgi:hypothetical protein